MSETAAANGNQEQAEHGGRFECRICWYLYDPAEGDALEQIPAGTAFRELPDHWRCPQCDAEKVVFLSADD